MFIRKQVFPDLGKDSCFLWGPRQSGKSTLLKQRFPEATYYDLLLSTEYERLVKRPALLREEVLSEGTKKKQPVIIDEVQKIPELLDEVQWLIDNHRIQFILCGSSARKLKRGGGNLLGGRALRYEMFPLVSAEITDFDLMRALNHGLLPRHYLATNPRRRIQSYLGDYLKEEIAAEALTRNVPAFSRFLESAAFSNSKIINYKNIAQECGVSPPSAKAYFEILVDTLLARLVPSYRKKPKRRVIRMPKFYFFDVGIVNHLLQRGTISTRTEIFGHAFEHFLFQELAAHSHYSGLDYTISYWRTASQLEIDFVLGEHQIALEVKGTEQVQPRHLKGLKAFMEEYTVNKAIVVSLDPRPRRVQDILILPWRDFLEQLWAGEIV